jgi:hypothetical protein
MCFLSYKLSIFLIRNAFGLVLNFKIFIFFLNISNDTLSSYLGVSALSGYISLNRCIGKSTG